MDIAAMTYELGVDVSKWQTPEKVDWRKLRDEAGVRFVIARHSYGLQVDSTFWRHGWAAMRAGGITVSGYQYLVANRSAAEQASLAIPIAKQLEEPYVLDVEGEGLTKKHIDEWLTVFIRSGLTPMIYCSRSSWQRCYGSGAHPWGHLPLWVANYTNAATPAMPEGWSDWVLWQFTSKAQLAGYKGDLDCNRRRL